MVYGRSFIGHSRHSFNVYELTVVLFANFSSHNYNTPAESALYGYYFSAYSSDDNIYYYLVIFILCHISTIKKSHQISDDHSLYAHMRERNKILKLVQKSIKKKEWLRSVK